MPEKEGEELHYGLVHPIESFDTWEVHVRDESLRLSFAKILLSSVTHQIFWTIYLFYK